VPILGVSFEEALRKYLPEDLPNRERVAVLGARHLELVRETNRVMNLTRIVDEKEAAIKHVWDSVRPWRLFSSASSVLDAGTGAGFPGLPLALVLPATGFTLCESIQKKANFVATAAETLEIDNVTVEPARAEEWLRANRVGIVTARAMAPILKILGLLAPALRGGAKVLLYKGPDVESEIEEAAKEAKTKRIRMMIVEKYELPEHFGSRTIVELSYERSRPR
jgi:16S rRNA (guanine527-N7)-methyltransferase